MNDTFRATGVAVKRMGDAPLTRFQVIGERGSGTDFFRRLLLRNTGLRASGMLGWTHGPAACLAVPRDLLVVLAVRRADMWSLAMHARPLHAAPHLQRMTFGAFVRSPWEAIVDRPEVFGADQLTGVEGMPLQLDRDPLSGAPFQDLFDLRQSKLVSMLSFLERDCDFAILRYEDFAARPEASMTRLRALLGTPDWIAPFRPVVTDPCEPFVAAVAARPETPRHMPEPEMRYLLDRVDLTLESALGYEYGAQ